jgi:hypothetical protein
MRGVLGLRHQAAVLSHHADEQCQAVCRPVRDTGQRRARPIEAQQVGDFFVRVLLDRTLERVVEEACLLGGIEVAEADRARL